MGHLANPDIRERQRRSTSSTGGFPSGKYRREESVLLYGCLQIIPGSRNHGSLHHPETLYPDIPCLSVRFMENVYFGSSAIAMVVT